MTNDTRTFYGPHACARCGKLIVKASFTQGGEEFGQPDGPIYQNTDWTRHNCDHGKTDATNGGSLPPVA